MALALSLTVGNAQTPQRTRWRPTSSPTPFLPTSDMMSRFINGLEVRAIKAVIPPKSAHKVKRACDLALYAERNLVERFNTLKHYRGIATRYHKTARNFLVGLQLVCGLARLK